MAKGFKKGVGGANPLNFKVVGGTTKPDNPRENTIWVNMSTKIADWHLSNTRPKNPVHGTVWIYNGKSSGVSFNALKKNELMVYPIHVERYIETVLDSGESYAGWDKKEAKIYQNGEWVDWIVYLYNEGNLCEDITGGFVTKALQYNSSTSGANELTITQNTNSIKFSQNGVNTNGIAYTKNKIRLSGFKSLCFTGTVYAYDQEWRASIRIWSDIDSYADTNCVLSKSGNVTDGTLTIDVSSLSGDYYIGVSIYRPGSSTPVNYVEITKMWLE